MRYCPDNIGRDTISRDANLYDAYIAKLLLRVTPLHYLLGQGTYHASCNSFTHHRIRELFLELHASCLY